MEMDQLQTVLHVFFHQIIERLQQFAGRKAELAGIASGILPFATSRRSQLDTNAKIGFDPQSLRHLGYQLQLVHFFYYEENALSHLLSQQGKLYVTLVLISITDNQRIRVHIGGNHRMQLRFGACFQSQVELLPMTDNLLDHRAHLIDLNGVDDKILRLVAIFLRRLLETAGNLFNPVVKNIGKTHQHRSRYITQLQLIHQFF